MFFRPKTITIWTEKDFENYETKELWELFYYHSAKYGGDIDISNLGIHIKQLSLGD